MHLCVRGIGFVTFYNFDIGCWKCFFFSFLFFFNLVSIIGFPKLYVVIFLLLNDLMREVVDSIVDIDIGLISSHNIICILCCVNCFTT